MKRAFRLTNNASFNYIYRHGTCLNSPILALIYVKATCVKVGVSVGKKVGNSVTRNKAKRRLREAANALLPRLNGSYNYVIAAREGIAEADYKKILETLTGLLKKAGHLKA